MADARRPGADDDRTPITAAKHLLLRSIAGEPVPERTPLLPVELIVRGSCGAQGTPSPRNSPGGKPVAPVADDVATCSRFGPALAG
jgi:hypothetical protein